MTPQDVAPYLSAAALAAELMTPVLPGAAGIVARITTAALRFAADLAANGVDAAVHIERLHSVDAALAGVEAHWRDRAPKPPPPDPV